MKGLPVVCWKALRLNRPMQRPVLPDCRSPPPLSPLRSVYTAALYEKHSRARHAMHEMSKTPEALLFRRGSVKCTKKRSLSLPCTGFIILMEEQYTDDRPVEIVLERERTCESSIVVRSDDCVDCACESSRTYCRRRVKTRRARSHSIE